MRLRPGIDVALGLLDGHGLLAHVMHERAAAAGAGATSTSTPRRASRRMVASLISGRSTCCAQPASRMTRLRRSTLVAAVPGPANLAPRGGLRRRQVEHGHQLLQAQPLQGAP